MGKGSLIDCPHCGKKTFSGGGFCSMCGKSLQAQPTPSASVGSSAPKQVKTYIEMTPGGSPGDYQIVIRVVKNDQGEKVRVALTGIRQGDVIDILNPPKCGKKIADCLFETDSKGIAIIDYQFTGYRRTLIGSVAGSAADNSNDPLVLEGPPLARSIPGERFWDRLRRAREYYQGKS